jgi:hypothetical protein
VLPGLIILAFWVVSLPSGARLRAFAHASTGAVVPAAVTAWYHTVCFGAPWHTGYAFLARPEFVRGHATGLMGLHLPTVTGFFGLLVGPRRGLFMLAPFTALAVLYGGVRAMRSTDIAARAAFVSFTALLLANAGYYMWWGGAAAGPRHLVPVLPLLAFGAAAAWQSRLRWVLFGLAVVSVFNVLALTAVGIEAPDRGHLLFDYVYHRLARGEVASLSGASNLGIRLGLQKGATLGPILVWLLLGARFLAHALPRDDSTTQVVEDATPGAEAAG